MGLIKAIRSFFYALRWGMRKPYYQYTPLYHYRTSKTLDGIGWIGDMGDHDILLRRKRRDD